MNVETSKALAAKMMAGLREAAKLTPAQGWRKLIELGMIDEEGRVSSNIGGRAKTRRPVSRKLLAR